MVNMYDSLYLLLSPNILSEDSLHFNSHNWPRHIFSLRFQYNIKQTTDENKENIIKWIISWPNTNFSKLPS